MAEQATKNQNAVLKEMINGSWNGIGIISLDSKIIFINKAFSPILGYSESELLQLKLLDIIIPHSKQPFANLLKDNIKNQYNNRIIIGCIRKDKQTVYLDIVIKLMSNNKMFVINANDVTADVAEKEILHKFIVQYHINKHGNIVKASEAFCRLTNYTEDELKVKTYKELLHRATDENSLRTFLQSIIDGKSWKGMLVLKRKDNSACYVDFISKPTKNKYGDIIGHSAAMMDITSEIKLQKNEVVLKEQLIDGEEKLKIMTETMRTVAHEWRQPLNTISLDAQSLLFDLDFEDNISKEDLKEKLSNISNNTKNLSSVIANFQAITELKGSKKKRKISDILYEALKIAGLDDKEFVKETYQDTPSFRTYPKELASAISSILINAKEITSLKDNKQINISTSLDSNTNKIICKISNNGGHIPLDIIDKIFTPYFTTKQEKNGVGLSLYTCKIIIELHLKGTIKVQNLGTDIVEFTLSFPIGALEE